MGFSTFKKTYPTINATNKSAFTGEKDKIYGGIYTNNYLVPTTPPITVAPTNPTEVYKNVSVSGNGDMVEKQVDSSKYFTNTSGGNATYGDVLVGVNLNNDTFNSEGILTAPKSPSKDPEPETGGSSLLKGNGDGEKDVVNDTGNNVMTYEQYIAEQKDLEEKKRQAALREAEIYKERAARDAQASYLQNMSTYGVNAENMAKMGLTGGGYSDYLNAQAYAQKRSDMQTASANELALKQQAENTYADGIAALNKDLFTYQDTQRQNKTESYNKLLGYAMDTESGLTEETIRAMGKNAGLSEEEIQSVINTMNTAQSNEKGEYSNDAFTALIADLQNPTAYGNYSEAGIRALGKQWGWTDEQIQQAVDIWNGKKNDTEVSLDGESGAFDIKQEIKNIQDGLYVDNSGNPYTWEYIHEMLLRARNAGENVTDTDIANAKAAYDKWIFYKQGNATTENYYDALYGKEEANSQISRDMTTKQLKQDAKNKVGNMLGFGKGAYNKYSALDIYESGFKPKDFGDFVDADDPDSKQGKYTQKIIDDAKANKIPVGSFVTMNYGASGSDNGNYIYMGDGIFVKLPWSGSIRAAIKDYASQFGDFSVYVPDGYKLGGLVGTIREE